MCRLITFLPPFLSWILKTSSAKHKLVLLLLKACKNVQELKEPLDGKQKVLCGRRRLPSGVITKYRGILRRMFQIKVQKFAVIFAIDGKIHQVICNSCISKQVSNTWYYQCMHKRNVQTAVIVKIAFDYSFKRVASQKVNFCNPHVLILRIYTRLFILHCML